MWEGALRVHGHHKNHVICTGAGWRWQVVPASLRILRSGLICGQVGKTSSRQKTDQIECFQGELTTFRLQNEAAKNSGFLCYMRSVPVAWRHKRNVYNGRVGRQRAMVSKERALLPLAAKISCSSRPCAHPHQKDVFGKSPSKALPRWMGLVVAHHAHDVFVCLWMGVVLSLKWVCCCFFRIHARFRTCSEEVRSGIVAGMLFFICLKLWTVTENSWLTSWCVVFQGVATFGPQF